MDLDMAWLRGVALVTSNLPSLRAVCRLCGCLGKPQVCKSVTYLFQSDPCTDKVERLSQFG